MAGAGFLDDAGELRAAETHVIDVGLRGSVAIFEGSLFFGLAPEDFIISIGVERRIDVDQIHTRIRQPIRQAQGRLGELFEVIAAVDDAGIE